MHKDYKKQARKIIIDRYKPKEKFILPILTITVILIFAILFVVTQTAITFKPELSIIFITSFILLVNFIIFPFLLGYYKYVLNLLDTNEPDIFDITYFYKKPLSALKIAIIILIIYLPARLATDSVIANLSNSDIIPNTLKLIELTLRTLLNTITLMCLGFTEIALVDDPTKSVKDALKESLVLFQHKTGEIIGFEISFILPKFIGLFLMYSDKSLISYIGVSTVFICGVYYMTSKTVMYYHTSRDELTRQQIKQIKREIKAK